VGPLLQRIEREQPSRVADCLVEASLLRASSGQPLERNGELPAQAVRLEELPVLEVDAVA
jgi:hypothetical protein